MENLKSRVILLGIIFVLMFTLAACGNNTNNADVEPAPVEDKVKEEKPAAEKPAAEKPMEKVKIVFGQGADQTEGTKKMIAAFHAKFPNIEVEVRDFPNNSTQMHDQYVTILGGQSSEIDVINLDVIWPAEFAQAGFLLPLDRFIEEDRFELDNYLKGGVNAGYFNGQQWALPRYNNTGLLYYRTDIVKTPPATWDELQTMAKKYQGMEGTKFGYVLQAKQYEGLVVNFTEFVYAYGGKILDSNGQVAVNDPATIKGLQKLMDIVQSDFVPTDIKTFTEGETANALLEGQAVFSRDWPARFAQTQDATKSKVVGKIAIAPLPAGDAGSAAALGGWLAGINKYSAHPREAWEFMKFMAGPEGQKIIAVESTQTPTYLPLYDDADVQKASPLFADRNFVEGISGAVPRPQTPIYAKISDIIQIEVSKAIAGEQTAEQAVTNMETEMKKVIQ